MVRRDDRTAPRGGVLESRKLDFDDAPVFEEGDIAGETLVEMKALAARYGAAAEGGAKGEMQARGDEVKMGGGLAPIGYVMSRRLRRGRRGRIFQLDRGGRRSHDAQGRQATGAGRVLP